MIHLDTSFLIRSLVKGSDESRVLERRLRRGEAVRISAIAWAEFLCGPLRTPDVYDAAELLGEPVPITGLDATIAAQLYNASARRARFARRLSHRRRGDERRGRACNT